MLEFLGYVALALAFAVGVVIVIYVHSWLLAFICFWIGITIGSMLILHFKQN